MRKTRNLPMGAPLSNVQHLRVDQEEPEWAVGVILVSATSPRGPGGTRPARERPSAKTSTGNPGPARTPAGDCSHHTVPGLWAAAPGEESSLGRHGGAVE